MAKATLNPELRTKVLDIIRSKVHDKRGDEIHASDVDGLCLLKSYYRRAIQPPLPLSDLATLYFMRGLAVESWLVGGSTHHVEKDGIHCNIDDLMDLYGIIEIKSTVKSVRNFKPLETYPWWVTRAKTYCYACERNSINLEVFFLLGDYRECRTDLQVWTLEFTKDELAANWEVIQMRKEMLYDMIKTDKLIPMDIVDQMHKAFMGKRKDAYWQCDNCEAEGVCEFKNGFLTDTT